MFIRKVNFPRPKIPTNFHPLKSYKRLSITLCEFYITDTLSVNTYGMPQSGSTVSQRESSSFLPVTQPASAPVSPVGSPVSQLLSTLSNITLDPNWQAIKSTVRERNAAMFNNDLMADIYFIVGSPG